MAEESKPIGVDATGYDVLTNAVLSLLNQYPALNGREIYFEQLEETSGIAFSADNGSLVMSETEDVLGRIEQECQYPFFLVYRTASTREYQKLGVQEFLDGIGKWICQEPVEINGETVRLRQYPALSQGRKINRVTRMNSYGLEPNEDGVQDWLLPITVRYTNEIEPLW